MSGIVPAIRRDVLRPPWNYVHAMSEIRFRPTLRWKCDNRDWSVHVHVIFSHGGTWHTFLFLQRLGVNEFIGQSPPSFHGAAGVDVREVNS